MLHDISQPKKTSELIKENGDTDVAVRSGCRDGSWFDGSGD